ncbi:MAG TPA: prepilin peptidase, partial [Polyangiales bacterium]|nr:prepilin peptidase [Polyangiales bacterium]
MHLHPQHQLALIVVAIASVAAIWDLRTGLIPNWLVAVGFSCVLGLRVLYASADSHVGLQLALLGLGVLISGLIPLALYLFRAMGAGDVKLMAVCGAGLGPVVGLEAELYAFGFGALVALGYAAYGGELLQTLRGSAVLLTNPWIPRRLRKPVPVPAQRTMRFGPAIWAGVIAAV